MDSPLHERLLAVAGPRTYRGMADLTGVNAETVRRYMQGQTPSVEFLATLCAKLGINAEWLLCGRGPMKADDIRVHALKEASGPELLGAMATTVERLAERVDRLEVYIQTLETRMRARDAADMLRAGAGGLSVPGEVEGKNGTAPGEVRERTDEQATTPAAETSRRARRIADAIPQRSRADAD